MKSNLWAVLAGMILFAALLPAANVAYDDAAHVTNATETHTVDFSTNSTVGHADAWALYDNETITHNGTTLVEGENEDYVFNTSSGEIDWHNTANTTDGEPAEIEYYYEFHEQQTREIAAMLGRYGPWLGILLFGMAIVVVWDMAGGGGF